MTDLDSSTLISPRPNTHADARAFTKDGMAYGELFSEVRSCVQGIGLDGDLARNLTRLLWTARRPLPVVQVDEYLVEHLGYVPATGAVLTCRLRRLYVELATSRMPRGA